MRRGDLVAVALQGDLGKPRPALVVQDDAFVEHPSVVVLPITSTLIEAPLLRPRIEPTVANGLRTASQIMVDKVQSVSRTKIGAHSGTLEPAVLTQVERALAALLRIG